jgi:serine/threonine-protein kinase
MHLNTGDMIDEKYRIVRLLGEGGMGAVYEGENLRIHRRVAIKVLHSQVAANANAVARFEREAQAAGRIGSEHIVEVLDLGQLADGDRYMVMEFMDGQSLNARIRSLGRMTPVQLLPITVQLLEGLKAAHEAGIIHRDLKPDNVYLVKSKKGQADFVKLLDFGISKFNTGGGEFSMTRTGSVMGTPYYMAPEQAKGGREVDYRVDIYALGVILYEAVSGQVPFTADTFNELLFKIVLESPRPIEEVVPELDPAFAAIIKKAMERDPNQRFQSCLEFDQALNAWAARASVPAPVQAAPTALPSNLPQGTQGTWAQTGVSGAPPAVRNTAPLLIGLAASLVAVLAIGGFVAYKFSASAEHAAAAAAETDLGRHEAEAEAKQKAERLEQEKKRAEEAQARAERERQAAENALLDAEKTKKAAVAGKQGGAAQEKGAPQQAQTRQSAPPTAPAKTGSASAKKTNPQGRQIRTEL